MKTKSVFSIGLLIAAFAVTALSLDAQQPPATNAQQPPATPAEMQFVKIAPGQFTMGCAADDEQCFDEEKPAHLVKITKGFEIGKYEVTQAQWQSVMGTQSGIFSGDTLPVENVSWNDVQKFIQKMNARNDGYRYRLPTEAEWEYAARAGSTGEYPGKLDAIAWYNLNSADKTHPVGQKQPNAWGLYDTIGNVWEWVQDWYDGTYYLNSPASDPAGPSSGETKVARGGSWNYDSGSVGVTKRFNDVPTDAYSFIGFRCVREASQTAP